MKQFFTLIFMLSFSSYIHAQCSELFFSEYVEGWSNNKALEIYNPTPNAIDLSGYSISRYSNGSTSPSTTQLEGVILPCSTFVVGLDKRDEDGVDFEAPMWDGYYTYTDSITGEEVTIYDADDDLQSKVDLFVNPTYSTTGPTTLYFNGNDAVTIEAIGTNYPLDLIGKVGQDPGASWTDQDGNYWTKDHTLIRKSSVLMGVMQNPIEFDPTLEWDSLPANTFVNLGTHDCDCDCSSNSNLLEFVNNFYLYPNPSNQQIITVNNDLDIINIYVHNNLGQIVLNKSITNLKQSQIVLPNKKGLYFVSITDKSGTKTQPIILN